MPRKWFETELHDGRWGLAYADIDGSERLPVGDDVETADFIRRLLEEAQHYAGEIDQPDLLAKIETAMSAANEIAEALWLHPTVRN